MTADGFAAHTTRTRRGLIIVNFKIWFQPPAWAVEKLIPVPGGAVAISGNASNKDEYCPIVGIRAAGLDGEIPRSNL